MKYLKQCIECGKTKDKTFFHVDLDGEFSYSCTTCFDKRNKPRFCLLCQSKLESRRSFCQTCKTNFDPKVLTRVARASKRNIEWNLTNDETLQLLNSNCIYCGSPGGTIDRVDSSGDYKKENCVPSCLDCNIMKGTKTVDDWLDRMQKILSFKNLLTPKTY